MHSVQVALLATSVAGTPSTSDLHRAKTPKPLDGSRVLGETSEDAFSRMNAVLSKSSHRSEACETYDHDTLNAIARELYAMRSSELDDLYTATEDKRALHFADLEYKEQLWVGESLAHRPGTHAWNATRDGKCAELVMWYIHHLSEPKRQELAQKESFSLPLMPLSVAEARVGGHEYAKQITCTDCHVRIANPAMPGIVPPEPRPPNSGPQFKEQCDETDAKPVFYNRQKRCDWDYEPFCAPCEGIGGYLWGNGEDEFIPIPCEPLMSPEELPEDERTTPLWPLRFTVSEYAMLTFPGRDPCAPDFHNGTYTLVFDTTPSGPLYHTISTSGYAGPSSMPGKSWAYSNGNFYTTVDADYANESYPNGGRTDFCVCLGPEDPSVTGALNGPLPWDFLRGALFIGRERITPEYVYQPIVADHWVKGPHHFWYDVETNLMIREWQPFNGLNIYYDWKIGKPSEDSIVLDPLCTSKTNNASINISCHFDHPEVVENPEWLACGNGPCCNPSGVIGETCPDGTPCMTCGGADSCQCPGETIVV